MRGSPVRAKPVAIPGPCMAALAGLVLAASGCGMGSAGAPEPDGDRAPRVRRGELVRTVLLTGRLEAVRAAGIVVPRGFQWQNEIRWIETDGARVREGQRVLELDNTALVAELEDRDLALRNAEIALAQRRAEVEEQEADKAFTVEERRVELRKAEIEAAIPRDLRPLREHQEKQLALSRARSAHREAVEDLRTFRASSHADLAILEIDLEKARRQKQAAEESMSSMVVSAPSDGILVIADNPREGRKFQPGDSVWTGQTVARIPDLSEMKVVAQLMDVDDGLVEVGAPTACTPDAFPDLVLAGRIVEVSPVAQEMEQRSLRRTFRVTIALEESDPERLLPGMSVRAEVEARRIDDALLAPRASLDLSSRPPAAVLAGGARVEVRVGPCDALECVVEEGLADEQRLGRAG